MRKYRPKNTPEGDIKSRFCGYVHVPPNVYHIQFNIALDPLIKAILNNLNNIIVLDIGCGAGSSFIHALIEQGLNPENIYSLDADEKNFEKDLFYPRPHKIISFGEKLNFKDNSFDLVYSSELTMDNPKINYKKVLSEISRVLKPDGIYLANERFEYRVNNIQYTPEMKKEEQKAKELWRLINSEYIEKISFKPFRKMQISKPLSPKMLVGIEDFYVFQKNKE